jgi:exonuclease V gamma subunit
VADAPDPLLLQDNDFSPLKYFLADGDAERRYQLVSRLADLIDLYQVYRTDWLQDWSLGLISCVARTASSYHCRQISAGTNYGERFWLIYLEAERLLGRVNAAPSLCGR